MPKKKILTLHDDEGALRQTVGESPSGVVRDLVQGEMAKSTDSDALTMALALQQIARGQNSILEMVKQNTAEAAELRDELRRMKQEAAERDEAVRKWQENQEKFLQDVLDKASKLRESGERKDKTLAEAAHLTQQAMAKARVRFRDDARKFEEDVARMPKVTVIAPGEYVQTIVNGSPTAKLLPTVIRIKHMTWNLPPGRKMEVPQIVADALYARLEGQAKNEEFREALSSDMDAYRLRDKMKELRKRDEAPYDPAAAPSPIAEENTTSELT